MSITLSKVPGFNDTPDSVLTQNKVALGVHVAAISDNAAFGLVRPEFFQATYFDGDDIPLPVSSVDGYQYSRSELLYMWGVSATTNPKTGWISGPDSLWYMQWNVDQTTGHVTCIEWYRPWASAPAQSADGQLLVTVVGIRGKGNLLLGSAPTYADLADAVFYQDAPWKQATARGLSHNSKYAAVAQEVIYMGEFYTGKTVPQAVSPVDGHTYTRASTKLVFSWRWTTEQGAFNQPVWDQGQFAGMFGSINPTTGAVALSVKYIRGGGEGTITTHTDHGRVAVFALCDRNLESGLTLGAPATAFAEVTQDHFYPGEVEQASVLSQVNKNIREAVVTPEFFGPTTYYDQQTIPVPTSAVDGHVYTRAELFYHFEWDSAAVGLSGHNREALFYAKVDPSNGKVSIDVWRLPPGGGYSHQHGDGSTFGSVRVTVIACRTATNSTASQHVDLPFPTLSYVSGGSTGGVDQNTTPAGTGVKIWGSQYFPVPVAATCKIKLRSSNLVSFNGGVCNVRKVIVNRTLAGSKVVIDSRTLTFAGATNVDIAASSEATSDGFDMVLDAQHDYYILCSHWGTEGQIGYNAAAVTALLGKIESSPRLLYINGSGGFPNESSFLGASDMSTYFATIGGFSYAIPATSDTWSVIAGFGYDPQVVAPPVDSGSLTSDGGDGDTINGV